MTMPLCFGTDGIRGRAYDEISLDLAYRLGRAVATVFTVPVFVGYDTRESSPPLAAAVMAGLRDGGANAVNIGYFTTPGVAVIARQRHGAGVVVSASHNPYYDNGLKVLGLGGTKLDDDTEAAVTAALATIAAPGHHVFPDTPVDESAEHDYAHHLRKLAPGDIASLHVVIDCANGAASHVAHELFESTGAKISMIHDEPNGRNINENCGSTCVDDLVAAVKELGADLGLALDGDADRLIAVDHEGVVRDGDDMMVLFALDRLRAGTLGTGLVVTSMSNLGLHRALAKENVEVVEVDVGDRNVLRALEDRAWNFGGEQSGHLIFRELSPTGDGLLTGLLLSELVVRRGALSAQAKAAWRRVPQALVNVDRDLYDDDVVAKIFDDVVQRYDVDASEIRLLIRPSGTEPVVRVMIEALNAQLVEEFASRVTLQFT